MFPKQKPIHFYYVMLILVTFMWSTNFIIGKSLSGFPPIFLATLRFSVAGLILIPAFILKKRKLPRGRIWFTILLMGFTGIFIFNPLLYLGLHFTTSINATIFNSLSPLSVALLSHLWLKEELNKTKITGLFICILGIIFIASRASLSVLWGLEFNPGDIIIFFNTIVWAIYTVLIKKTSKLLNPQETTTLSILAGLLFLIPASLIEHIWLPLPPITLNASLAFIYLGLFPTVIAFFLWNTAVSKVGPTQGGIFYNLIPIFNIILAAPILHEHLSSYQLYGSLLIILGMIIAAVPWSKYLSPFKQHKET